MFDTLFNKTALKQGDKKSYAYTVGDLLSVCNNQLSSIFDFRQISLNKFLDDYLLSPIVFTAVKLIADNYTSIEPIIKEIQQDEFIPDHPLTDLLNKKANPFEDICLFKSSMASFYLITGNSYINVVGRLTDIAGKQPPIELQILNPANIAIESIDNNGFPSRYTYNLGINNNGSTSIIYNWDIINQKYLDEMGNELLHIKTFHPKANTNNSLGLSALEPTQLEIEQYLQASIHNNSVLKNEGRGSAIVTSDTKEGGMVLQEDQIAEIKERFLEIKGAQNAGKIMFLPFNLKWQAISESIKDMDFETLKTLTEKAVYKAFGIPLTFVTDEASTMNNKQVAREDLYDYTIIPLVKRCYSLIGEKLLPRYDNGENLKLIIDENQIPVLANRKVRLTKEKKELGALSINEIRSEIGKEGIGAEGDVIYQPSNLVPIGTDQFTQDNLDKPTKSRSGKDMAEFIRVMQEQKDLKGGRLYSIAYINQCVKEYYGE